MLITTNTCVQNLVNISNMIKFELDLPDLIDAKRHEYMDNIQTNNFFNLI